jgi:DNA-binding transcriptional ArsR family regulator
VTLLRLSPRALTRCRFAVSPLAETVGTLLDLERAADARFRRWRDRSPLRRGLYDLSARTKYLPDPLAVPPDGGMKTRLSDELALVAGFSDADVRDSVRLAIGASWGNPLDASWVQDDALAPRIAEDLADAWERFVRPDWPRRRAILERDIAYRTELLAAGGWRAVVATIAKNTSWATDDVISFGRPGHPDRIIDDGIIFVPHTEGTGTWTCEFPPPRFAMTYPARGRAAAVDPAAGADLARLVGDGRARVLLELRVPATSTELARILGVSLGTVSAHLAGLRSAGTIAGVRSGRTVRYRLDPRGWDLLAAFGVPISLAGHDQAGFPGADGFRS